MNKWTLAEGAISRRGAMTITAALVFALMLATATPARADRPAAFMNSVAKQLVAAARSGSPHILAAVIRRYADMPDISLYSLGSYRKQLPSARRNSYYDSVARFMGRYFVAQAKTYPIKAISVSASSKASWGYNVTSRAILTNGESYTLRWLVVPRGKGFKVRDVSILGFWMTPFQKRLFENYIEEHGGRLTALLDVLGA